ncbi:DUF6705 family protein [Chryseobacterium sp. MFBS3-17]|uniref:DUF6705 family protein n=1 Tax=Chryseobacterium sp. MFBS3-17 TaxID=2886689 RepID=UPI001D0E2AE1|nr:DUF6705 family protein [Chryseobacterium sp. MFBS3-17]MCC2591323.1 hypothetical protein [Chryseobacterium sp. MFBS3-17]
MKTIKKYQILLVVLLINISIKAQQIHPLNSNPYTLPTHSYMKDLNQDLDTLVGTWKAAFDGKSYTFYISKSINKLNNTLDIYQDMLSIRYTIKTENEVLILQDTQNLNFNTTYDKHAIYSYKTEDNGNSVLFTYSGTNCGVGWGGIEITKLNNNQFLWKYSPNSSLLNDSNCPSGQDLKVYLPVSQDLVFTKQ